MSPKPEEQYVFVLDKMERRVVNDALSTSKGASVSGQRMSVGLVHKARGTGSAPHRHSSEQFNFVLQGTLQAEINGQTYLASRGSVIHIPANVVHSIIATPEEDVIFFVCKDTTGALGDGVGVDPDAHGPRYESGFGPEDRPPGAPATGR